MASATVPTSIAGALLSDPSEANFVSPKKRAEPMGTAVGGTGNVTPVAKEHKSPQKISCWQNGELILEQSVIAPKDKVTDYRLLHSPTRGTDMLAFDFKNAFCFIK